VSTEYKTIRVHPRDYDRFVELRRRWDEVQARAMPHRPTGRGSGTTFGALFGVMLDALERDLDAMDSARTDDPDR
jgi:hypothetical protein